MNMCTQFQAQHGPPRDEAELAAYCTALKYAMQTLHRSSVHQPGGKHNFHKLTAGHGSHQGTARSRA